VDVLIASGLATVSGSLQSQIDVHTHTEADITDLDKYTQAEVDSLINTASGVGVITFTGLTDTPATYSGTENMYLYSTGSGIDFVTSNFTTTSDLTTVSGYLQDQIDTKDSFPVYDAGKYLRSTASGVEWSEVSAGVTVHSELSNLDYASSGHTGFASKEEIITVSGILQDEIGTKAAVLHEHAFTELTGTPVVYDSGKYLKSTVSGTEWAIVESGSGASSFTNLTDTPATYSGSAGKYLRTTASGIEFVDQSAIELTVSGTTIGKQWFNSEVELPSEESVYFLNETTGIVSDIYQGTSYDEEVYAGSEDRKTQISSSSEYNASYEDDNAFDGANDDQYSWISANSGAQEDESCWLQWDFGEDKRVSGFRMAARNGGSSNEFPKNVKVYCSDLGNFSGEESLLDSFTLTTPESEGCWCDWVTITSPEEERYFRICILTQVTVPGSSSSGWVAVGEVEFKVQILSPPVDTPIGTIKPAFTDLTDTPTTYSGIENNYLRTTTSGITTVSGIILSSPDGSEWRIIVDNSGNLSTEAV